MTIPDQRRIVSDLIWRVRYLEALTRSNGVGAWTDPHSERLHWRNAFLRERVQQLEKALTEHDQS